jgi:hypothetical protein
MLGAGSVFRLEHDKERHEGEYLVTKLDVHGEQAGVASVHASHGSEVPFTCAFECARRGHGAAVEESRFRPARTTPRPRIVGSQTAFVTADPSAKGAEIHVGGPPGVEIGCVRLRFHWDREEERLGKEPSSCWVRVSQAFAGKGEGALWHPRVGVEVIVEFLDGDPDRPIVTGRVYNGQNRPPGPASGAATVSIMKSFASPGAGVHNEFGFDDTAGSEQVKMHAGKDWNSTVGHDRAEKIANDSSSDVGVDRSESTGANRSTSVGANNTETVGADESVSISANQTISVGSNQTIGVGADQSLHVGANRTISVGANQTASIGANEGLSVGANRTVSVSGNLSETVGGNAGLGVSGSEGASEEGVELPAFTLNPIALGPLERAALAMDRVAGLLGERFDGALIVLVPERVADAPSWRDSVRAFDRMVRPQRVRLAVFAPPGGPINGMLGAAGARFRVDAAELAAFLEDQGRATSEGPPTGEGAPATGTGRTLRAMLLDAAAKVAAGKPIAAAASYRRARELCAAERLVVEEAMVLMALGGAALAAQAPDLAIESYSKAAGLAAGEKAWQIACQAWLGAGGAYLTRASYAPAVAAYRAAARAAEQGGLVELRTEALRMEATCLERSGLEVPALVERAGVAAADGNETLSLLPVFQPALPFGNEPSQGFAAAPGTPPLSLRNEDEAGETIALAVGPLVDVSPVLPFAGLREVAARRI